MVEVMGCMSVCVSALLGIVAAPATDKMSVKNMDVFMWNWFIRCEHEN